MTSDMSIRSASRSMNILSTHTLPQAIEAHPANTSATKDGLPGPSFQDPVVLLVNSISVTDAHPKRLLCTNKETITKAAPRIAHPLEKGPNAPICES